MDKMVKRLLEAREDIKIKSERTDAMEDAAQEIMSACRREVEKYMTGPKGGFPEDEVWNYAAVDVSYDRNYDGDLMLRVEVRAEVSYEGLESLCDLLNPVVSYYDPNAYFEPVDAGIIEAWLDAEEASKEDPSVREGVEYEIKSEKGSYVVYDKKTGERKSTYDSHREAQDAIDAGDVEPYSEES